MSDIEFISGLSFKAPNDNAPEYVKAKGSIKVADLKAWLATKDGEWVNFDLKVSNGGKWYAAVDNWKPSGKGEKRQESRGGGGHAPVPAEESPFPSDDIPFLTMYSLR